MKEINTKEMMKAYNELRSVSVYVSSRFTDPEKVIEERKSEKMAIFAEKAAKLTTAIKETEGRASVRCIASATVMECLLTIERNLSITKTALEGVEAHVDYHAQDFPKAYKYTPESTHFCAVYRSGSWRITNISRSATYRAGRTYTLTLTDAAKAAIIANHTQW